VELCRLGAYGGRKEDYGFCIHQLGQYIREVPLLEINCDCAGLGMLSLLKFDHPEVYTRLNEIGMQLFPGGLLQINQKLRG